MQGLALTHSAGAKPVLGPKTRNRPDSRPEHMDEGSHPGSPTPSQSSLVVHPGSGSQTPSHPSHRGSSTVNASHKKRKIEEEPESRRLGPRRPQQESDKVEKPRVPATAIPRQTDQEHARIRNELLRGLEQELEPSSQHPDDILELSEK